MKSEYGSKKGEQVFYASINAGKVKGDERKPHVMRNVSRPGGHHIGKRGA